MDDFPIFPKKGVRTIKLQSFSGAGKSLFKTQIKITHTYLKIWKAVLQSGGWQFAPGAARPKGAERGLVATCHWWMTGCLVFVLLLFVSFPGVRTCQHQLVSLLII